jgi:hypothetical protein
VIPRLKKLLITAMIVSISCYVLSDQPRITNVTMTPANPGYGENFHVDIELCIGEYVNGPELLLAISSRSDKLYSSTSGQVFLVSSAGVNVPG